MDLSKFKTNDWLVVGGGALMLIAGFLTWYRAELPDGSFGVDYSGFDFSFTGLIPWILLVGAGVLVFLVVGGLVKANVPPMIIVGLTALALLLVIIRLIAGPGHDVPDDGVDVSRGIGLWLALIAGIVSTVGAFLGFQAAGGNIRDFTDPDKIKGAARRTGR